jgi:RNA polymerase-interacting CarD/CdnL/TRCF family regulator
MNEKDLENLKIGDKIIDFGRVYRVFKINKKGKSSRGRLICFRPFYKKVNNRDLVCTIPEKNLSKTNMRRPLKKKEVKELLKDFLSPFESAESVNFDQAKKAIATNDPFAMINSTKNLYYSRKGEGKDFTVSQKRIFNSLIGRIAEESAFVLGKKPEQIKEKINNSLKKGLKKLPPQDSSEK